MRKNMNTFGLINVWIYSKIKEIYCTEEKFMKKCEKCGKEYSDEIMECPECNVELVDEAVKDLAVKDGEENSEQMNDSGKDSEPNSESVNDSEILKEDDKFCVYCGNKIEEGKTYCNKCGRSILDKTTKHCIKCGEILSEGQKFCPKCGQKADTIVIPQSVEKLGQKAKKIPPKKLAIGGAVVLAVIVITLIVKAIFPQLFTPIEDYLKEAEYQKAYEKAGKEEKKEVLIENIIAYVSSYSEEGLKDPESFKLREAYYEESNDNVILKVQGKNSYGGNVSSYYYFYYSDEDEEYKLYDTYSDFDEQETYSFDDYDDKLEAIVHNAGIDIVRRIVNNKNKKVDADLVDRINSLHSKGKLENVKLIKETESMHKKDET